MSTPRTITIEVPDCIDLSPDDLDVLRTTCETIITMASGGCAATADLAAMREQGWAVTWGLTWIARARRQGLYEEAVGTTKDEVMARLARAVRLHEVEGTP